MNTRVESVVQLSNLQKIKKKQKASYPLPPHRHCALIPQTIASAMISPREKEYLSRLNTCTLLTILKEENDFLFTSLHSGGGHNMLFL